MPISIIYIFLTITSGFIYPKLHLYVVTEKKRFGGVFRVFSNIINLSLEPPSWNGKSLLK